MTSRDRSSGWQYAKLSGHKNEENVIDILKHNQSEIRDLLLRIDRPNQSVSKIHGGGKNEKNVENIIPGERKTKSKTDIYIDFDDGTTSTISLKKSDGSQAYLVTPEKFVKVFESQYMKTIPTNVQRAMHLYWGTSSDINKILEKYITYPDYELRKHRLTSDTLFKFDPSLHSALLSWFRDNIYDITDLCISRGAAANPYDWAQYLWHLNTVDPNATIADTILEISDICEFMSDNTENTIHYSPGANGRTPGTTIRLPFGFVEWHDPKHRGHPKMQFHLEMKRVIQAIPHDLQK